MMRRWLLLTDAPTRRALLVGAAALLYFLAFPPVGLGLLGFVALVPLHLGVRGASARAGAGVGFAFGLASGVALFAWALRVRVVGAHHLLLLSAYLALYPAVLGALWSRVADRASALWLVPAVATGLDWLRGHAGVLACPWLTPGQTQHENVALLQLASVGGEPLVELVVVAANVALGQLASRATSRRPPLAALAAVGLAHAAGWMLLQPSEGRTLTVAVVQPDFAPEEGRRDGFERLERLTRDALVGRPDLVVWPESAAGDTEHDLLALFQARAIVDRAGVPVLFGASSVQRGTVGHNSLFLMKPGEPLGEPYRKVRLVPFAEYAPAGLPASFGPRLFDTIPGESRRTFALGDVTVDPLICFESLFAGDLRATASPAPGIVAVAVNDAWFGDSAASALHNLAGAFRAVESRRPVAIASNGGPSQIFDANGRVVARARPFTQGIAVAAVRVDAPSGPYRRWGDLVTLAVVGVLAAVSLAWARRVGAQGGEEATRARALRARAGARAQR